jgi:hypothetical protein
MFRLFLWPVRSGMHQFIAVLIAMNMAATGVAITIATDSIAFRASAGTGASGLSVNGSGHGGQENHAGSSAKIDPMFRHSSLRVFLIAGSYRSHVMRVDSPGGWPLVPTRRK